MTSLNHPLLRVSARRVSYRLWMSQVMRESFNRFCHFQAFCLATETDFYFSTVKSQVFLVLPRMEQCLSCMNRKVDRSESKIVLALAA